MPLSAAVHDSPHCGRGQRGIDFFFKSPPVLTSGVAEEKRDILAYFKRVGITEHQEDKSYKSLFINNLGNTECPSSSEGEEIKPEKNGKVNSKKNSDNLSYNCKRNVIVNEATKFVDKQKKIVLGPIILTDEAEHKGGSENILSAKADNPEMYSNSGKLSEKTSNEEKSHNRIEEKNSPGVTEHLKPDCKEEIIKDKSSPLDCKSSEGKGCLEKDRNGVTKSKGQTNNSSPPGNGREIKKNAFAFMMANRMKPTETGKPSPEEEKPLNHAREEDGSSKKSDSDCMILCNITVQQCEMVIKNSVGVNPIVSKKSLKVKNDKEKEDKSKVIDLDSSLQDFDLTPYEKPKKGIKPKTKEEDKTVFTSCADVAVLSDPDLSNSSTNERAANYISFAEYMKSACSMVKEGKPAGSTVKVVDGIMKSEAENQSKENEPQHHLTTNSNAVASKEDSECLKDVSKENVNPSLGYDKFVRKRKLFCYSENVDEKQEVQTDQKVTTELPDPKQVPATVRRKKMFVSSDSDEDIKMSKVAGMSGDKKRKDSKNRDEHSAVSNTTRISSFFKKINQKEEDEEENRVVFTVQADVHAPLDGNKTTERRHSSMAHSQACGESGEASIIRKEDASNICSTKKNTLKSNKGIHSNCNLDELNKIELLEQIPPPKPLSKRVLKKVEKDVKTDNDNIEKLESKIIVTPKKGELPKKRNLNTRQCSLKNAVGAGKKLLRRKKSQSASSEEESSEELFIRKKRKKPLPSDKDTVAISSSCSISSGSSISSVGCQEDVEEKSGSTPQSSPEASEDDKENVAHYTSQLLRRPGKLSLRIKRIHPPQGACGKDKKLKQRKSSKSTECQRLTKILKKAKGSKNKQKKRLIATLKQKSSEEEAAKDLTNAGQAQAKHELVMLDSEDEEGGTRTQIFKKATGRRRKVTQTLLKPLIPKATPKGRGPEKKDLVQESPGKFESEVQNGSQRRTLRRAAATARNYMEVTVDDEDEPKKTNRNCKKVVTSKAVKLAPIFCKRPASPSSIELLKVVPLSPSKLKARQEFLNSSVSDAVRRQVSAEKSVEEEGVSWPPFPEVSHTQQREEGAALWNLKDPQLPLKEEPTYSLPLENLTFTEDTATLRRDNVPQIESLYHLPRLELGDIVFLLSCMKSKYQDFPVYKVFKAYYEMKKEAVEGYQKEVQKEQAVINLVDDDDDDDEESFVRRRKRKCRSKLSTLSRAKRRKLGSNKDVTEETPQNHQGGVKYLWHEKTPHMWTQIFMPKNVSQVIGNADNVRKLRLWLQEWKNKPQFKPKRRKKKLTKKDDFVVSDESTIDDEDSEFVSTYLLSGPPGVGKTAAVYALASELGYKVLEVNASSRRPGRQVMSQLAEATQSHTVSNASVATPSQSSSAFSAFFTARNSSSAAEKDVSQKEESSVPDKDSNKMKGVSLVLFEDIDVVFEEWDDGFMSTVNSLMSTTKRPIILTATHSSPVLLSRIKESFEVMEFVMPPQKLTGEYMI